MAKREEKSWIDAVYKEIGENDCNQDVKDWLSIGYLPLNKAISGRFHAGLPVGRITEIFGAESCGKTLQATKAIIETQKRGGLGVYLDFEHAFSLSRAVSLGMVADRGSWIYKQPTTAEEAFVALECICKEVKKFDPEKYVTVIDDSVAAMITKAELEAGFDGGNMKTRLSLAACLSENLKKLAALISNTNVTMIFLNQTRSNPGVMFGDKEKTTGGNAMKFYASVRMKLTKMAKIKNEDTKEIIGEVVEAQMIKNKVYDPFRTCRYNGSFSEGIDLATSHIEDLKGRGMFGDTMGWLEFAGTKYRMDDLIAKYRADREFADEILKLYAD